MKRTFISTVLTASLLVTFDFSTLSAADLGLAGLGDLGSVSTPPVETQLIARRGGGGRRGRRGIPSRRRIP